MCVERDSQAHPRATQVVMEFDVKQKVYTHSLSTTATQHTLIAGV
jgi:hypothetical protein